jgi:hypothetical protein
VPLATIIVTVTAVAAIMSLCLVLITRAQRRRGMHGLDAMIGLTGRITKWDRQEGQVFVRGESWKAVSSGEQALAVGDRGQGRGGPGPDLTVAPENQDARESSPSQYLPQATHPRTAGDRRGGTAVTLAAAPGAFPRRCRPQANQRTLAAHRRGAGQQSPQAQAKPHAAWRNTRRSNTTI